MQKCVRVVRVVLAVRGMRACHKSCVCVRTVRAGRAWALGTMATVSSETMSLVPERVTRCTGLVAFVLNTSCDGLTVAWSVGSADTLLRAFDGTFDGTSNGTFDGTYDGTFDGNGSCNGTFNGTYNEMSI